MLDVRALIDKVTKSRAKENGTSVVSIPEGSQRMTLSIKMSTAKTCTFQTDWKKCCIFQGEKNDNVTYLFSRVWLLYIIATNMQYFSSMPSGSLVLDHTRLDKGGGGGSTEGGGGGGGNALKPSTCTK